MEHEFDEQYFHGEGKSAYSDYKTCKDVVFKHAEIILDAVKRAGYRPESSFDAGCAYGYIVQYLASRGIDARGSDISEWAIEQSPVKERVWVAPLPDLEGAAQYDLVTCSEVLEHIPFESIKPSMERLLDITKEGGILVIMPNMSNEGSWLQPDAGDSTHISMVPRSWWIEMLAELGYERHTAIEDALNSNNYAKGMFWGKSSLHPEGRFFAIKK